MYEIEVIRLRHATMDNNKMIERIKVLAAHLDIQGISIFLHVTIDNDISVHLHYPNAQPGTDFKGQSLASLMKEYGLVNYSRWVKCDD